MPGWLPAGQLVGVLSVRVVRDLVAGRHGPSGSTQGGALIWGDPRTILICQPEVSIVL